jgi:folate-binding protein YgfZ
MLKAAPMPYKTKPAPAGRHALADHGVLGVHGPQAQAFLQAQTMNDVAALAVGHWQWNGWLNAKGRVLALFALLRADEQRFLLVLPDADPAWLRAELARFVFRSKVVLEPAPFTCAGECLHHAGPAAQAHVANVADGGWWLDLSGDALARRLWLLPQDEHGAGPGGSLADAWREADLVHGWPRLGEAQRGLWTPHMLSLQRLSAFSLRKGCYPGQEIVARTHYLGQAKRGLRLFAAPGLREGAEVTAPADGRGVGAVVSLAASSTLALAVAAADAPEDGLACAGTALAPIALAGGLQRPV